MSSAEVATSTTDLPTGDPIPSSSAAAAPPPKPKPFPLRELVAATPSNIDAFLAHVQRCLQTPSGIDTCLLFLCYTSRLGASVLTSLAQPALGRGAGARLLALAQALPPSATLVFGAKALPSSGGGGAAALVVLLQLARRLKALSVLLSEARTFLRLWGLLGMYFWARRLVLSLRDSRARARSGEAQQPASSSDSLETSLAWTQLAACVVFQSLENAAYLSAKGVLGWGPAAQAKMSRWSARFWGTFVGLEIGRLLYESHRRGRRTRAERFGDKTVAVIEREEREWSETWRKSLVRQMAWAPLTVHWSLEQGLVSEMTIGALASVPGVLQMRDLWRRTAE
ncbi:hypothetical protein GGR56DRAFT_627700 [Xylariaceae sp. FL0804]|nr:hypothetical protein GGR56DRAFT_627700 [Xylariaceae sp. FL0804]